MARGQRSFRESVKARRTHWSAVSPHACACAHVHSSGLFLLSKRPLEHTTDYFPAISRVRAQFTMQYDHYEAVPQAEAEKVIQKYA